MPDRPSVPLDVLLDRIATRPWPMPVAEDESHVRLWAYAALGWIGEDEARRALEEALTGDPELADVVATALADVGDVDTIPAIHGALSVAKPWQRIEIEGAITALDRGEPPGGPAGEDWRLRYRPDPRFGGLLLSWPVVAVLARDAEAHRDRHAPPVRPLDEILADPWDEANEEDDERCECCGVVPFRSTGTTACPETAAAIALIQWEMLGEARAEDELGDLFDVLDVADDELWDQEEPEPRGRRAREARDDRVGALTVLSSRATA